MKLRINDAAAIAICALVVLFAEAADTTSPITGSWRLNNWTSGGDRVHLELTRRTLTSYWSDGNDYPLEQIHGLTRDQLHSLHTNVHFEVVRDAGALVCDGSVVAGVGGGTFQFSPSAAFESEMRAMGYSDLGEDTLFSMLTHDVNLVFVREVKKNGLRDTSARELVRLRIHGITPEYIADIRSAGYDYSADDLVRLKIHGVNTDFLRDLKRDSYNLNSDEVVKLRNHGVDSDYVHGLSAAHSQLSPDEIVKLKNNGVDPDFIRDLKGAHYEFSTDEIVRLRNNGLSADFARDVKRAGYDLSAEELIHLRINGVDAGFLAGLRSAGYGRLSPQEIVHMWQNGVRADYIARLQASGMKNLTPDQIIKLKIHGID